MPYVKSKYFNIAELLHNALLGLGAEILSQRRYVPNVKSRYFNLAELLHNALVAMVAEILSQKTFAKCEVKIL